MNDLFGEAVCLVLRRSRIIVMLTSIVTLNDLCLVSYRLIRRSYLEIALLYLHFATNKEDVSQTDKMVPSKSNVCFLSSG